MNHQELMNLCFYEHPNGLTYAIDWKDIAKSNEVKLEKAEIVFGGFMPVADKYKGLLQVAPLLYQQNVRCILLLQACADMLSLLKHDHAAEQSDIVNDVINKMIDLQLIAQSSLAEFGQALINERKGN